jgi:hypothetical protein
MQLKSNRYKCSSSIDENGKSNDMEGAQEE